MPAHERIERLDEITEALRRDGGILDECDRLGVATDGHQQTQARLAHPPHPRL